MALSGPADHLDAADLHPSPGGHQRGQRGGGVREHRSVHRRHRPAGLLGGSGRRAPDPPERAHPGCLAQCGVRGLERRECRGPGWLGILQCPRCRLRVHFRLEEHGCELGCVLGHARHHRSIRRYPAGGAHQRPAQRPGAVCGYSVRGHAHAVHGRLQVPALGDGRGLRRGHLPVRWCPHRQCRPADPCGGRHMDPVQREREHLRRPT